MAEKQMNIRQCITAPGLWLCLLLSGWLSMASAADSLNWRAEDNRVDAQIESWSLNHLLENMAAATGWQIYVEPDTQRAAAVKFKGLAVSEALGRLLGDLNFALLPQTNAASKLFVYRTSVQDATQLIVAPKKARAKSGKPIPNELLVTLKPGSKLTPEELARLYGAKLIGSASDLHTYRLLFENADAVKTARDLLESASEVESVGNNFTMELPPRSEPLALSSSLPAFPSLNPANTGNTLVVGLIDTAVQPQGSGIEKFLLPSISVVGDTQVPAGQPTHGTSMAETILQAVASTYDQNASTSIRILPVNVYSSGDTTTTFDVANGIVQAVNAGAKVINLSLGGDGDSTLLHKIIQDAAQRGIFFTAAAGNDASTAPTFPAAYPEVIAVTAGGKNGLAAYANRGDFVDAVAPGTSIISFQNQSYLVTGTSASTANFTGWLAAGSERTGKPLAEIKQQLLQIFAPKSAPQRTP